MCLFVTNNKEIQRWKMTQKEIDRINETVQNEDARIYWSEEVGWTSKLYRQIMKRGSILLYKKGNVSLISDNKVVASGYTRVGMLVDLANKFKVETLV